MLLIAEPAFAPNSRGLRGNNLPIASQRAGSLDPGLALIPMQQSAHEKHKDGSWSLANSSLLGNRSTQENPWFGSGKFSCCTGVAATASTNLHGQIVYFPLISEESCSTTHEATR